MRWMGAPKTSGWRMRGKKDEGMVCEVSEEAQTAAVEWMRSRFQVVRRGQKPVAESEETPSHGRTRRDIRHRGQAMTSKIAKGSGRFCSRERCQGY